MEFMTFSLKKELKASNKKKVKAKYLDDIV